MSVLTESLEKLLCDFLSLNENDWVLWTAQPNDWNDDCDKFNGCFFVVKNMPRYPQHANCRCTLKKINQPVPYVTANADCRHQKIFRRYFCRHAQQQEKGIDLKIGVIAKKNTRL